MKYKDIADSIIELKNEDLKLRDELIQSGQLHKGYNPDMEKLHNKNAVILDEIIGQIGYPTIDKVGLEASQAAWLVVQHAISQPGFMKKCVALLENLDEINAINLAYLKDRIASYEEKPQYYGTQFDWDKKGELSPNPIADLANINQRRKAIGLNSIEAQTAFIRAQAKKENQSPPEDYEQRKEDIQKWKIRVGWIKNP